MSLLELHRRSGDANLGQTLIRLARMASQAHALSAAGVRGVESQEVDSMRAVAGGPEAVVRPVPGTDAQAGGRTAHTEVRR